VTGVSTESYANLHLTPDTAMPVPTTQSFTGHMQHNQQRQSTESISKH